MELLDAVILKDRTHYQIKITNKDFEDVLNNEDFYLIQKGLVCFGDKDELATLYEYQFKKECRILVWVK